MFPIRGSSFDLYVFHPESVILWLQNIISTETWHIKYISKHIKLKSMWDDKQQTYATCICFWTCIKCFLADDMQHFVYHVKLINMQHSTTLLSLFMFCLLKRKQLLWWRQLPLVSETCLVVFCSFFFLIHSHKTHKTCVTFSK